VEDGTGAATARFEALVTAPGGSLPLDEAALLIAAHAYPDLEIDAWIARLDRLADGAPSGGLLPLAGHLFGPGGFAGNDTDYYDPRNSYLNDVLDRRLGIPITLSIVAIEIGRRVGVPLVGIGMPGHFLVRDADDAAVYLDPFTGSVLDVEGCAALFRVRNGPDATFHTSFLEPVPAAAIVSRVLANLKGIYRAKRDRERLEWVLRLRIAMPSTSSDERRELASVLAADGRFGEAAKELEFAADLVGETDRAAELRAAAVRLRARLN
jgi:regulator of sirC expression with transglutaminase-like and TPR domain